MSINASTPLWQSAAVLVGRVIFAGIFLMATSFKFLGMAATASYIAAAGFPAPLLLAWVAAIFEALLAICFLTGAFFTEAALLSAAYVLFLSFVFPAPSHGAANRSAFGLFIGPFTFIAGLLFAAVNGPGRFLVLPRPFGRSS
jgi:uncharacterized membrane protein YphA (DoxX/SURF4 family)